MNAAKPTEICARAAAVRIVRRPPFRPERRPADHRAASTTFASIAHPVNGNGPGHTGYVGRAGVSRLPNASGRRPVRDGRQADVDRSRII